MGCSVYNTPRFFNVWYDIASNACTSASYDGPTDWLRYFSMSIAVFFFLVSLVLLVVINGSTVWALRCGTSPIQLAINIVDAHPNNTPKNEF